MPRVLPTAATTYGRLTTSYVSLQITPFIFNFIITGYTCALVTFVCAGSLVVLNMRSANRLFCFTEVRRVRAYDRGYSSEVIVARWEGCQLWSSARECVRVWTPIRFVQFLFVFVYDLFLFLLVCFAFVSVRHTCNRATLLSVPHAPSSLFAVLLLS